jgi:hypothetical protein
MKVISLSSVVVVMVWHDEDGSDKCMETCDIKLMNATPDKERSNEGEVLPL